MAVTSRRFLSKIPRLVGRPWNDVVRELENWFRKLTDSVTEGIPGGYSNATPDVVQAGVAGDPGLENEGWASAGHNHAVETATAVGLGNTSSEGSGTALARAQHVHKRDVRVAKAGSDVGTRNRLNFIDGANATVTVVDDGGADEIDITVAASSSPVVAITTVSSDTTLNSTNYVVLVDASGAARTITLPAAASHTGRIYYVKKIDSSANAVIIDANGAELIDGNATVTMTVQYLSRQVVSDGTGWAIL